MSNRPAIPTDIAEEVLFEARYRCAADCEPVSLERCHIIPWSDRKEHRAENLVVLCANCHTRSHAENWPASRLRRIKERPCALERDRLPPMSAEQRLLIDAILSCNTEDFNERERLRFLRMMASYLEIDIKEMSIARVEPTNSTRVVIELPETAARKFEAGVREQDPRLLEILSSFPARIISARVLQKPAGGVLRRLLARLSSSLRGADRGRHESLVEAPSLAWKAVHGSAEDRYASAMKDYAKAENERIDAELKRRTLESRIRQVEASASKLEAEARLAQLTELQARLALFDKLKELNIVPVWDETGKMTLVKVSADFDWAGLEDRVLHKGELPKLIEAAERPNEEEAQ